MKLSDFVQIINQVIKNEGDLETSQIVIKENEFHMLINDTWHYVENYQEDILNKVKEDNIYMDKIYKFIKYIKYMCLFMMIINFISMIIGVYYMSVHMIIKSLFFIISFILMYSTFKKMNE